MTLSLGNTSLIILLRSGLIFASSMSQRVIFKIPRISDDQVENTGISEVIFD